MVGEQLGYALTKRWAMRRPWYREYSTAQGREVPVDAVAWGRWFGGVEKRI